MMIRFISLSLIALLPALAAQQAHAGTPQLRAATSVSADVVTLGDLVSDAGALANTALFRAPDLGQTGQVSSQDILVAAAAKGLANIETGGIGSVSVTRASRVVSGDDLRASLMTALALQSRLDDPNTLQIDLNSTLAQIHLPVEADGTAQIVDAFWHRAQGTFEANLVVRRIDGRDERRALYGRAVETVAIVTVTRAVERGAVLAAADVSIERRPLTDARAEALDDMGFAIGKEVRRAVREGQSLRASDLAEPTLVKNGSTVTVILKSGGLNLTATAQALGDGRAGATVQVMNAQSKRVLQAVVSNRDEVTIQPARSVVSAAK